MRLTVVLGLLPALLLPGCAYLAAPAAAPAPAPGLPAVDAVLGDSAFRAAPWGVAAVAVRTGETLYERNAEKAFTPASTMKLVTGAVALEALGPEYRYRTRFLAAGPVQDGVLRGDLVVRGAGDPTFSGRFLPNPRDAMRAWADSLRARGITRVAGGIIGVDSAFAGAPVGLGWAWDDLGAGYAAELGALQFNEGVIRVQVMPSGTPGAPAVVVLDPATQFVRVENAATTAPPGTPARIDVERDPAGPGIAVRGVVPADTPLVVRTVAVRDPTDYFLSVLRETLRESGVAVEGQALDADDWPVERFTGGEAPLFTHESPPLREILPAMLKPSQNWIAETLLRTLGLELRGVGSAEAGVAVVDTMLGLWSVPTGGLRMADGSGLSRYDLLTPELLVALLAHMSRSTNWQVWLASLPVAGQSGTLAGWMTEPPLRGNVHAKTGTLSGVRGLAGYLVAGDGGPVAFAMLVNGHFRPTAEVNAAMEAVLEALAAGS